MDRLTELMADLRELESLYNRDKVAQLHANQIERIFDKWLYADDAEPLASAPGAECCDGGFASVKYDTEDDGRIIADLHAVAYGATQAEALKYARHLANDTAAAPGADWTAEEIADIKAKAAARMQQFGLNPAAPGAKEPK